MGVFDLFRTKPEPAPAPEVKRRPTLANMKAAARMFFGSGDTTRLSGDWPTMPVPAEWIISRHQRTVVARSREQYFNNDYMKAYLRLCRQNIVGSSGIVFQSKASTATGKPDLKARKANERAFRDWMKAKNCDVAGNLSWRAIQAACVDCGARDGEFMLRKIRGADAGKYGFALQILDPQRCPVDLDEYDLPNDEFIRSGIRYNRYGRPLSYAFTNQSEDSARLGYTYAGRSFDWVPADEIIHGFKTEIIGQKRGLPWLATGLFRMKQMGAFEDAAVVNARVGAAKMGVVEFADGTGPEGNDGCDENGDMDLQIDAEAGAFLVLPNGAKLNKFDPTYPAGEFASFIKQCLRSMAAGGGVSYHNLAQDLEGVNFSSIRQGTLDEREHFKELQEWLCEVLCEPVFEAFLESALLRGKIIKDDGTPLPASKIHLYEEHEWQGRRWDWIDPTADMKAAEGKKNNLLASPGALIREQGGDPDRVWEEIGQDIASMRAAGIPDEFIKAGFSIDPVPPKPEQKKEATP
ncbi:MAG TPA: phage portal protein [Pyrinomonadaceae bacterium]|nr:phage portal protein [Pyrinomonadaceae bacterium]